MGGGGLRLKKAPSGRLLLENVTVSGGQKLGHEDKHVSDYGVISSTVLV